MELHFITSNKNKFEEAKILLGNIVELKHLNIDLPEIQSINTKEIIKNKLMKAFMHDDGPFIVEDTSLLIEGMNGLPGPFIKFFISSLGLEGIFDLTKIYGDKAYAKTSIGYAKSKDKIKYFEGTINGRIVSPKEKKKFSWDSIFMPDSSNKRFSEMTIDEKNEISHRKLAFDKLKKYL